MGDEILVHHGIKGQRWGIRRFQNEDGTRTAAGKAREERKQARENKKQVNKLDKHFNKTALGRAQMAEMASMAAYSKLKESDYEDAARLLDSGRAYVEGHTSKNYKNGSIDVYQYNPNDPVFHVKMVDGKQFAVNWVNDNDRLNYEKFVEYYKNRSK